jgi:hypothetical protein
MANESVHSYISILSLVTCCVPKSRVGEYTVAQRYLCDTNIQAVWMREIEEQGHLREEVLVIDE